jgi:hypothetical protein
VPCSSPAEEHEAGSKASLTNYRADLLHRYILGSWKLGWWELGAKLFVFQEVYETLLYLLAPFVLPISLIVRPAFCGYLLAGTLGLYFINVTVRFQLSVSLISLFRD